MENEKRETSKMTNKGKSYKKVFSYYFDNAISKSSNFVIYIVLISFILGLLMTFLKDLLSLNSDKNFFNNWWINVSEILELGQGDSWSDRLVEFIFWVIGIAVTGTVIGFLSTKINTFFKKMSRGKSFVIDSSHILIVGWSNNLFAILKELNTANKSNKGQKVVIFSNIDNTKMQDDLALITSSLRSLKIITRSGDPTNPAEILIPNPNQAKSILILNNESKGDPYVVTTTLSVCSVLENNNTPIIASVKEKYYYDSLKNIIDFNIIPVMPENVISNVSAQSLRQRGLGLVLLDFLDFDGDEIYFKHIPELTNLTFIEAMMSFENSSLIGLVDKNMNVNLSVENEHIISKYEQLIFVAEDDSKITYSKINQVPNYDSSSLSKAQFSNVKRILFIGWSSIGNKILDSISGFLEKDSVVDVLYIEDYVNKSSLKNDCAFNINFETISFVEFDLTQRLKSTSYEDVMVLGYSDKLPVDEADTFTLLKSLELDSICRNQHFNFRILTHILNSSKSKLSEITHSKEIIISDNLSALLMAQLSENPYLYKVFEQLFSSESSSINIFPIEHYIDLEKEITYREIVYSAALKKHNAVGLLFHGENESNPEKDLHINPKKSMILKPTKGDSVIVIS